MGGRNGDTTTWNNAPFPPLFFWKTQTVTPCLQEKRTTKTPAAYWKHPPIVEKTWNQPPSSATFSRPRGIGIMVNGRLVCLGSASQLKATHGYGALAFFNYKNATQPEATNQHQLTLFFFAVWIRLPNYRRIIRSHYKHPYEPSWIDFSESSFLVFLHVSRCCFAAISKDFQVFQTNSSILTVNWFIDSLWVFLCEFEDFHVSGNWDVSPITRKLNVTHTLRGDTHVRKGIYTYIYIYIYINTIVCGRATLSMRSQIRVEYVPDSQGLNFQTPRFDFYDPIFDCLLHCTADSKQFGELDWYLYLIFFLWKWGNRVLASFFGHFSPEDWCFPTDWFSCSRLSIRSHLWVFSRFGWSA